MKKISFNVAKVIKKAGYPQDYTEFYYDYNRCVQRRTNCYVNCQCVAPTFLEVWLWLWREKKIAIEADYSLQHGYWINGGICGESFEDPEDAIIAAINYLVDNDLIK